MIKKIKIINNIIIIFVRIFILISLASDLDKNLEDLSSTVKKKFYRENYDMRTKEAKKLYKNSKVSNNKLLIQQKLDEMKKIKDNLDNMLTIL